MNQNKLGGYARLSLAPVHRNWWAQPNWLIAWAETCWRYAPKAYEDPRNFCWVEEKPNE